tara:strand:+ start:628 stop:756 length:129 start_codon:yes stop_codon:yes gene_type:complete
MHAMPTMYPAGKGGEGYSRLDMNTKEERIPIAPNAKAAPPKD